MTIEEWLQENLRIILSIFMIISIGIGIYSYSERTYVPEETKEHRDYQPSKQDCYRDFGNLTNVNDVPVKCKWYFED